MINWFDVSDESPNKDLALKNLKVTQNGTYGESGVAYSSVEVNVSGGGGGSSDFKVVLQTVEIPETSVTGAEDSGYYVKELVVGTLSFETPVEYDEDYSFTIFCDDGHSTADIFSGLNLPSIDGVDLYLSAQNNSIILLATSESPFTITLPQTTIEIYKASADCVYSFGPMPVLTAK